MRDWIKLSEVLEEILALDEMLDKRAANVAKTLMFFDDISRK